MGYHSDNRVLDAYNNAKFGRQANPTAGKTSCNRTAIVSTFHHTLPNPVVRICQWSRPEGRQISLLPISRTVTVFLFLCLSERSYRRRCGSQEGSHRILATGPKKPVDNNAAHFSSSKLSTQKSSKRDLFMGNPHVTESLRQEHYRKWYESLLRPADAQRSVCEFKA